MLRIGELARRANVTVKALHHYDDIGLLKPAHVDTQTGYRYYTIEQAERVDRILALKDLGLSLDQIGYLLDRDAEEDDTREILKRKQADLRSDLRTVQARITRVERRLAHNESPERPEAQNATPKRSGEQSMSTITELSPKAYDAFTERLQDARSFYLPMVFGTTKRSLEETTWLDSYSEQYAYVVDDHPEAGCAYVLRRADHRAALWFSFILPFDWSRRHEILDASLPNLIAWFGANDTYRYLFAQLDRDDAPPTFLESFLPTFLRHGFNSEYRLDMRRPGPAGLPEKLPLPRGVSEHDYAEGMGEEITALAHKVYTLEGVNYSLESASRCVSRDIEDEMFSETATFLRNDKGELVGGIWWSADE